MDNEELQKLKELAQKANDGNGPKGDSGWPFLTEALKRKLTPAAVLELIARIEELDTPFCVKCGGTEVCATQPAQEKCGDCSGRGYNYTDDGYPGDGMFQPPDPPSQERCEVCDGSGIEPAQEPVSAARAVPEGFALVPKIATQEMQDAGRVALAAGLVPMANVYRAMVAAAPSPQPQPSGSIDTPEFKHLIYSLEHSTGIDLHNAERRIIYHIDAWKDAACAESRRELEVDVSNLMQECSDLRQRATDAEAKLAAVEIPTLSDEQIDEIAERENADDGDWGDFDFLKFARAILATRDTKELVPHKVFGWAEFIAGELRHMGWEDACKSPFEDGRYTLLAVPDTHDKLELRFTGTNEEPIQSNEYGFTSGTVRLYELKPGVTKD